MIIAGNWKMNMDRASAKKLTEDLSDQAASMNNNAQMIVFPPAVLIDTVTASRLNKNLQIGGQDCHAQPSGAHTGDISASMLVDAGCGWVLQGILNAAPTITKAIKMLHAKASAAIDAGLCVIICVGGTLEERMAGKANDVVAEQIEGSLPADFCPMIALPLLMSLFGQLERGRWPALKMLMLCIIISGMYLLPAMPIMPK